MSADVWGYAATLAGVALGGTLTGYFGLRQAYAGAAADRQARRDEFQAATVIAYQDAANRAIRSAVHLVHLETMETRTNRTEWGKMLFPAEVDEQARLAAVECSTLRVRLRDAEMRRLAEELAVAVTGAKMASIESEAIAYVDAAMELGVAVNERAGLLLRELWS